MIYEEFVLFADKDNAKAEYVTDELKIYYYMEYMTDGLEDLKQTITHEWLHALFDWATEGSNKKYDMIDADGEHFIMRCLHYNSENDDD